MLTANDLYPYQLNAIRHIKNVKKCALWIGLGLGKTVITLTACRELLHSFSISRVLVVAPLRVAKSVWKQELLQWSHLHGIAMNIAVGTPKQRLEALQQPSDIVVINRENVKWLIDQYCGDLLTGPLFSNWPFDMLVIDESSSFKNHQSQRFKALKQIIHNLEYCILLTGTPASNSMLDLWSQFYFIDRGKRLGISYYKYRDLFFNMKIINNYNGYGNVTYLPKSKKITSVLKDVTLVMKADDYMQLPPVIYNNQYLEFDKKEEKIYNDFEKQFFMQILEDESVNATNSAVLKNKLLQLTSGSLYVNDSKKYTVLNDIKIDCLEEMINDNADENIMIAYAFRSELDRLKMRFKDKLRVLDSNEKTIEDWNNGKIKLLALHPASGGHGLNLQYGGRTLIYLSLGWSLELYLQLNARLHRNGQKHSVLIHHIIIRNTIDEQVLKRLENKNSSQQQLIEWVKQKQEGYQNE